MTDSADATDRHDDADASSISFPTVVGLLWYSLYINNTKGDGTATSRSAAETSRSAFKRERDTSEALQHSSPSPSPAPAPDNNHVGASPEANCRSAAAAAASRERSGGDRFAEWGEVNWVLLAAHVYNLTHQLHSDDAVRRIVIDDVYTGHYQQDGVAMRAALSSMYADMLLHHAQEEEARAAAAAAAQCMTTLNPTGKADAVAASSLSFPAASTVPSTAAISSEVHRHSSTAQGHVPQLPVTAGLRGPHTNLTPPAASVSGVETPSPQPPSSSATRTPPPLHSSPHPTLSTLGGAVEGRVGSEVPSLPASNVSNASAIPSPAPPAGSNGHPSQQAIVSADSSHRETTSHGAGLASPRTLFDPTRATVGVSALNAAVAATAGSLPPPPPPTPVEPDALDAPWYALWSSLPTLHARTQLRQLRYHTPLPLEDFSSLLEQFFLVEGADDFLNPVHAATIMEFAGVRSGPYHSIVRAPLSLMEVRRYITESHRHYARAITAASHHAANAETIGGGQGTTTASAGAGVGSTRVTTGSGESAEVRTLLNWMVSPERRVLTLAELERSIWHIAANCVVFNAPESRYPRTARRFAASCIEIIVRYCEKQMATLLTSS